MRYIVKDPLAILAAVLVLLTAAVVVFSLASDLPERRPIIGVVVFSLLPVFAISGAVMFYMVVRSEGFRGDE